MDRKNFHQSPRVPRRSAKANRSIRRRLRDGIYDWLEIIPVVTSHNAKIMSFYNAQTSFDICWT